MKKLAEILKDFNYNFPQSVTLSGASQADKSAAPVTCQRRET